MRGKIKSNLPPPPPFLRVPPSFPCSHAAAQSLAPTLRAAPPEALLGEWREHGLQSARLLLSGRYFISLTFIFSWEENCFAVLRWFLPYNVTHIDPLPPSPAPPSILSLQLISELGAGLPVLLTTSRQPPILTREREYMLTLLHHPTLSSRTLSSSPFSASASPPLPCESELLL